MRNLKKKTLAVCCVVFVCLFSAASASSGNLIENPKFEGEVDSGVWRWLYSSEDTRRGGRTSDHAYSGEWSYMIETDESKFTTVRGGKIPVEEGKMVEFSAWIKSELEGENNIGARVRVLFFDGDDERVGSAGSSLVGGEKDWTYGRLVRAVPEGTVYMRPYMDIFRGTGRAYFDDLHLEIQDGYLRQFNMPAIGFFTDLDRDDCPTYRNVSLLLEGEAIEMDEDSTGELDRCEGVLVLYESEVLPAQLEKPLKTFAGEGNDVFMDIRNFAAFFGYTTERKDVSEGHEVVRESRATSGLKEGDIFPRMDGDGMLHVLPKEEAGEDVQALMKVGDTISFARKPLGEGYVYGLDILSLKEPFASRTDDGSYYKYLFMTNTLVNPVRYGEWWPERYSYSEFLEVMKDIAGTYPEVEYQKEGPASGGYDIYSLNIGSEDEEAPLYFFYAAVHGDEWVPPYGLLTFTKRLARGEFEGLIDLDRVRFKIVPVFNPWGFERENRPGRVNANHVDINRQGHKFWDGYGDQYDDYDDTHTRWKGEAPFSEPEAVVYKDIIDRYEDQLFFVLDFHGNRTAPNNRLCLLPRFARPDNKNKAILWREHLNDNVRGRYILRQSPDDKASPYNFRVPRKGSIRPTLPHSAVVGDRYGFLIEVTERSSMSSILVSDFVCEIIHSIFKVYPAVATSRIEASRLDEAVVFVENHLKEHELEAEVRLQMDGAEVGSRKVTVGPMQKEPAAFELPFDMSVRHELESFLEVMGKPDDLRFLENRMDFSGWRWQKKFDAGKIKGIPRVQFASAVDGDLSRWEGRPYILLDSENDVYPGRARELWRDAEDFSVRIYKGWDEDNFYLAVLVSDEEHFNTQKGSGIWNGDSLQFGFNPRGAGVDPFNLALALASNSVRTHQYRGPDTALFEASSYKVTRQEKEGETLYELAIPFEHLKAGSGTGALFDFNAVVFNDNDGEGYDWWMQMSDGLAGGWDPGKFRTFVLLD